MTPGRRGDHEQRPGLVGVEADVAADGGDGAFLVDVYRLARGVAVPLGNHALHRLNELDVIAVELQLQRELQQARGAWITRVEAVSEAGRQLVIG